MFYHFRNISFYSFCSKFSIYSPIFFYKYGTVFSNYRGIKCTVDFNFTFCIYWVSFYTLLMLVFSLRLLVTRILLYDLYKDHRSFTFKLVTLW